MNAAVDQFFRKFEANDNGGDMDAIVAQFADVFLFAGPAGSQVVRAHDFAKALPGRKRAFKELGCKSTTLLGVEQVMLGDRYVIASTRWRMSFQQDSKAAENVTLDSTFVVDMGGSDMKIVLYLPHQDVMAELGERGLLTNTLNG